MRGHPLHVLERAALQARQSLDPALHARLDAAVLLVRGGQNFQTTSGEWQVDSRSTEGTIYTVNGSCPCQDAHYNKPAYCAHRLAMFLAQRVQTLMAQPPAPVVLPEEMDVYPDNEWPEDAPLAPEPPAVPIPAAPALPEAAFSLTLKGSYRGHSGVLLTVRGQTAEEFHANLAAVQGLLDTPAPVAPQSQPQGPLSPQQHNALAMGKQITGFCAVHNCQMRLNTGKDGSQWFSHRLPEGGFCKGR